MFFLGSYFALDTDYFNYMPLFFLILGFGGSIVRYTGSIGDLNTHLKLYHKNLFDIYAIKWTYAYRVKMLYPTAVFTPEMRKTEDVNLQSIASRVKMNLLFLVISFISFPIVTMIIMSWR